MSESYTSKFNEILGKLKNLKKDTSHEELCEEITYLYIAKDNLTQELKTKNNYFIFLSFLFLFNIVILTVSLLNK
jgi:hypothetical protein